MQESGFFNRSKILVSAWCDRLRRVPHPAKRSNIEDVLIGRRSKDGRPRVDQPAESAPVALRMMFRRFDNGHGRRRSTCSGD